MPIYVGSQKIQDIYSGNIKIGKVYKGSVLVYASSVNDGAYIKQPDFTKIVSFSANTARYASKDVWVNVCCESASNNNYSLISIQICKNKIFQALYTIYLNQQPRMAKLGQKAVLCAMFQKVGIIEVTQQT